MKILTLTSLFLVFFFTTIQSQTNLEWEARYSGINPVGNDIGNVISVDKDGFVYVAGKTAGLSNFDYIAIKYNSNGDTMWTRTFNGSGNGDDEILALEVDFLGNVYVTGKSMGITTGFDIVTIKYDFNGNLIWINTHLDNFNEDDTGKDLKIDAFSNVYVCGSVRTSNNKPVIFKISSNGSTLWTINTSVFNDLDSAEQLLIGSDGNLLVSAVDYFSFNLSNTSYRILEVNQNNGNVVRGYNSGIVRGFPKKFKTDSNGNIYMLSSAWWGINYEIYWAKFVKGITDAADVSGFSSTALYEAIDFDLDANNNFYILCKRFFVKNSHFIFRENFDNTFYWEKDFNTNTSSDDIPISIHLSNKESNSPSVFVTGQNSLGKMTLSKYSNSGDSLWTNFYGCSSNNSSSVNSTQIDKCDNIYFTGYSLCNGTGQDIKTIKYSTAKLPIITQTGTNPICEGTSIMLSTSSCSGCTYLWSTGETTSSISVSPIVATEYIVEVKYPSECVLTSLPKKIMVNPLLTPGVSISAASPSTCKGQNVIFTANPVNGGVNPSFQWYLNSVLQNGNTSTFSISTLNDGDVVSSIMTSNANCLTTNMAVSNSVTMAVFELLPTGITISSSDNTICDGESVTFLATPSNGGASPVYQWFVDGVLQPNQYGSSFATTLSQSAAIYGKMTSNAGCPDPSIVSSESIFITVKQNLTPQITISASLNEICEGENIDFTATPLNGGTNPIYQWFVDGVLHSNNNATFSGNNFDNGANIKCVMTSSELCTTQTTATSNIMELKVNPKVNPSIEIISDVSSICAGKSVTITSSITNGGNEPTYQWFVDNVLQNQMGNTFSSSNLLNGTEIFCMLMSNATCLNQSSAMSNPISFIVHSLPVAQIIPDGPTTFCQGKDINLTANEAQSYVWSTGQTSRFINVTSEGVFNVTITDSNGCTAVSGDILLSLLTLLTPTISISPSVNSICEGDIVDFTSELTNGGLQPEFQWYINGELQAEAGSSFSTKKLANNAQVLCRMTSNAECLTQPLAQSNIISIAVNPLLIPEVTISTISNSVLACQDVTITAIPTNGGITPSYQWFLNGGQVSNGSTYTNTSLVNGDQISCIMTSNANCKSASTAQSNIITMLVSPLPQPFIKVSGDTISSSNYFDPKYSYNWYYNGSVVSTSPFIFCNQNGSGSYYLLVNVNGCTVTSTTMDIVCTVPTIDISGNKYFTIFPNPTNNLVNISGKVKPNQEYKVTIYNVLGQKLEYKSLPVEGDDMSASLSLEYYVNGIYFIEIYGNNYRQQFKVYKID